jgi:8-oxo-dGTP pyrophosphatase MutT (NUDIX family)
MKNKILNFGMATFACIFNRDFSKVLLLKRNEEKRKKYGFDWGIVGGKIELGEYSHEAIRREIKEEIGINLPKEKLKLLWVKEVPDWFNIAHVAFFIYSAVIDERTKITINKEADEYAWFDVNSLPESRSADDNIQEIIEIAKKLLSE